MHNLTPGALDLTLGIQEGECPVSMLSQVQELRHMAPGPQFPSQVGW